VPGNTNSSENFPDEHFENAFCLLPEINLFYIRLSIYFSGVKLNAEALCRAEPGSFLPGDRIILPGKATFYFFFWLFIADLRNKTNL
jgi:hypothetical protein